MKHQILSATGYKLEVTPDPDLPYEILIVLSPPGFMSMMFVMLHGGSENLTIRLKTREDAIKFLTEGDPAINEGLPFVQHPRLCRIAGSLAGTTGTGDDNTCPQCDTAFNPPVQEAEFSCPKCQEDIYSGETRCKGCGAILDFSMPEGSSTTETTTETETTEESYGSCWSSGYDYGYCPYGYYDPYDPYLDAMAFATLCVIL